MNIEHSERRQLSAVLEFWHRIEFFIPFDLSSRAESQEGRACFWLHAETLEDDTARARRPVIPEGKEVSWVKIFFGVFDKSEMVESVRRFCQPQDALSAHEDEERADLEGDTCFASLGLDARGNPLFGEFSVSTLPWALGQIGSGDLAALSSVAFEESRRRLKESLANFAEQRRLNRPAGTDGEQPLTSGEILDLHRMLLDWAGFQPKSGRPLALVEIGFREQRKVAAVPQLEAPSRIEIFDENDDQEDDEDEASAEYDVGILNSFYLEDLERAIAVVRDGVVPEPLRQYLTPIGGDARLDLYSGQGRLGMLDVLHPRNLNRGRWPSPPRHAMSLMQQFAINIAGGSNGNGELFSVNGPPGTGKTTLLRDVIADNIVKRARLLAGLPSAREAFRGRTASIDFTDGKSISVSALKPELTGFEMVVASSNNTAVENISRDLPKRDSVGDTSVEYLQSVAHKVAAQTEKGSFATLEEKDQPWGLISCVLGNAKNRWAFTRRFSSPVKNGEQTTRRGDSTFQTIWGWLDGYRGPSFAEAAKAFLAADAAVEASLLRYARYADLFAEVQLGTEERYCQAAALQQRRAAEVLQSATQAREAASGQMEAAEARLGALKEEERLLDRTAPAWWQTVLPTKTSRRFREAKAANAEAQLSLNGQLLPLRHSAKQLHSEVDAALGKLEECVALLGARQRAWSQKREEFTELGQSLGCSSAPRSLDDLETDQFQIAGLWHSDALAAQRSDLFGAALRLHAAWLAEVGKSRGGFRGNIFAAVELLSGNLPVKRDDVSAIWHSFFMIVPVVSTTFASFARQFRGVGTGELGWLFIDEAGQAVPQAAVGALTRARRAMVIGDPLQIEPVFTLPTAFIKALADLSPHTEGACYSPTQTSVQMLADAANSFGTAVPAEEGEPLWIGSPLRVHRRCIDPMFSLANQIAYRGKMVFAAAERSLSADVAPFYGESAWIDIEGHVAGKQTVPEQVAFIAQVLVSSFRRDGVLPDIYVISPFKETKAALKREIEQASWFDLSGMPVPRPKKLAKWLKDRVGTVHTFQGKEENAVFMILGTDASKRGAAKWAASKPNLLNVAVTRARHRIFIVGDRDLWRGQPYFSDAAGMLQPIRQHVFLARLSSAVT